MNKQMSGEGEGQEDDAEEEQQESADIVQLKTPPKIVDEQLELDLLMKEKELEVLENITQVLKS